jgi:hypothetical protein
MTEHRMLDFLRAVISAEPNLQTPIVAPLRFEVRTGCIVPPKQQMRNQDYKVLIWKYKVRDLNEFAKFLDAWEKPFSDSYHGNAIAQGNITGAPSPAGIVPQGVDLIIRDSYLGTFPSRGVGGAPANRFTTAWGGTLESITRIEKCRVAISSELTTIDLQTLAGQIAQLLSYVSGDVEAEILDPSIGF